MKRPVRFAIALAAGVVLLVAACATAARAAQATASWYGPGLYGNVLGCASHPKVPARLSVGDFGVAHKSLPCGSIVLVCYRRCARARVIDRGPFVAGRDFDLTAAVKRYVGAPYGVFRIRWELIRR